MPVITLFRTGMGDSFRKYQKMKRTEEKTRVTIGMWHYQAGLAQRLIAKRQSNLYTYGLLIELSESLYFFLFFIVALVILRTDVQMNGDSRNLRFC